MPDIYDLFEGTPSVRMAEEKGDFSELVNRLRAGNITSVEREFLADYLERTVVLKKRGRPKKSVRQRKQENRRTLSAWYEMQSGVEGTWDNEGEKLLALKRVSKPWHTEDSHTEAFKEELGRRLGVSAKTARERFSRPEAQRGVAEWKDLLYRLNKPAEWLRRRAEAKAGISTSKSCAENK